jgi:glycine cleavage system aminomethyltransferase T
MASPNVAPVLAKEFVSLKLEADRMAGGKDILKRYQAVEGGIPWFVFLDGDGRAAVTSDGPKGNVGFPAAPHEIAHFRTMLEQSKRRLTGEDVNALVASLEDANRK